MADNTSSVAVPGHLPDIMNDPEFATNSEAMDDGNADACRICRGDGSDAEPLFHPCKCSGSIKFVHQDCLMEWLSHSQKKHCELCKTPFRFTKLYSPNMPQSLPFPVLVRHVIIHIVKNLATWLRFVLVALVWLACLPYILRQVWRLLFWFSDGGWPSSYSRTHAIRNSTANQVLEVAREIHLASLTENGTSPVTPFQASQTTSASVGNHVEKLFGFLTPISQTLNVSSSDPLTAGFLKSLYYGFRMQSVVISDGSTNGTISSDHFTAKTTVSHPSILSDVSFLRNLTRNPYVNDLVIAIVEGYIITVLVVVCFILVFLIREWVVQQQPGINMGAGFAAEAPAAERPRGQQALPEFRPRNAEPRRAPRNEERQLALPDHRERRIARARRRNVHFGDLDEAPQPTPPNDAGAEHSIQESQELAGVDDAGSSSQSRPTPSRDAFSPAVEIQRRLTEEPRMTEEFLAIWRRADSDPREVLRIIESENKTAELGYWVNAMKQLEDSSSEPSPIHGPDVRNLGGKFADFPLDGPSSPALGSVPRDNEGSSASSESWVDVSKSTEASDVERDPEETHNALDKGKGKAKEFLVPETSSHHGRDNEITFARDTTLDELERRSLKPPDVETSAAGASRSRARSDGPSGDDSTSLLGGNNWSFASLQEEKENSPLSRQSSSQVRQAMDSSNIDPWDTSSLQQTEAAPLLNGAPPLLMSETEITAMEQSPIDVVAEDGTVRTYSNVEEVFNANPIEAELEDSDSDLEVGDDIEFEGFPDLVPGDPIPERHEPVVARPDEAPRFFGNVADFFWGGVDEEADNNGGGDDEHIVQDLAAEPPFVPVANEPFEQVDAEQDREVMAAALAAGIDPNDQDAIDDAEDFEGIMELVGMRGPIFSLVQNALFSAFLLALAVAVGVWIPYNIGRIFLLLVANPGPAFKLPLRMIFGCAAFLQDLSLSIIGLASYMLVALLSTPLYLWYYLVRGEHRPELVTTILTKSHVGPTAAKMSYDAMGRIVNGTIDSLSSFSDSEMFAFSAASHEALNSIHSLIVNTITGIGSLIVFVFVGDWHISPDGIGSYIIESARYCWTALATLPELIVKPDTWVISLEFAERASPLDLELSVWDGWARFWAIFAGYTALCILGAMYVRKGSPFSSSQVGREWEASILDLLNQAGGVMKVILIISIEMLVFPLYCGLLLDAALLPLFENATIMSRINFIIASPFTSMFVHWFVGTCYMFHFALFVSMCRKIMRKGVLYFIRDPDDPTFHPVRDVLERNVATQLRKILFSALVYGALVVICLGGVVWGLALAFNSVLPIHWSSNEPVLEFPIDLLFYNFLMPLAVRFFKPSAGLHAMYTWWFRQCARMLRLTWFMFDERKFDEEGYHVRKNWLDIFRGVNGDPSHPVSAEERDAPFNEEPELRAYFRRDGKYVRAPASDQVRIPKGKRIFLEVSSSNERVDGKWDRADGVHGKKNNLFKQVYIPPFFQFRICLFILFIWLFAAFTGVGITIVPLVFGRYVFAKIIPAHVRKNDVYAFSIGIYILGSALYSILHVRQFISWLRNEFNGYVDRPHNILDLLARTATMSWRVARILWTYSAFLFILPTLSAFVVEFYFILPLHTYFSAEERHVVHFVQSWTLGLLYVKLITRLILWHENSRPAQSLRAVTRNGYLNPDAGLATRGFILPGVLLLTAALMIPHGIARVIVATVFKNSPQIHLIAYRYAYPICLASWIMTLALWRIFGMLKDWRMMIRDEVYLIGERLHNFGERKVASPAVGAGVGSGAVRRLDT
ncbi:RING/U-box [Glarea lozoyensis ATCC 20868]|uniref:RING-type E3 ubiquitin transferase n=1 Tax=Glarea lozoyensis (strain ATCC 20868 / MF5171) TaxID=1116229 RepID=S3D6A6_GLAL2|nr:RING/U-box [Glarea lozoyensis ATCC 20868]EPE32664.1 RING/U-box [Glarea lozoyensis ATCC 20868]